MDGMTREEFASPLCGRLLEITQTGKSGVVTVYTGDAVSIGDGYIRLRIGTTTRKIATRTHEHLPHVHVADVDA